MRIKYLRIQNFKSIKDLTIEPIENVLILVGKNSTGKSTIIDAIRVISKDYQLKKSDYQEEKQPVKIDIILELLYEDLLLLYKKSAVSKYRKYENWIKQFKERLPSYIEEKEQISFSCMVYNCIEYKYDDGLKKNNQYIPLIFPKIIHIDHKRDVTELQEELFRFYDAKSIQDMKEKKCLLDSTVCCSRCFQCVQEIGKKKAETLTVQEISKLLEYRLYSLKLNVLSDKINKYLQLNANDFQEVKFNINIDIERMCEIETNIYNKERKRISSLKCLSEGYRSIYALSLLEVYIEEENTIPCIVTINNPEIFLHPQLQKTASELLYRLSKKNQVIFCTHSPNMIVMFSLKQIQQVILDNEKYTNIKKETNIDYILNNLGYNAADLLNVNFVFIVEGKQDKCRLPLLLEKYYSEIYDKDGKIQRIAIITTNSCTNIKTYANLKYISKLYLRDNFIIIRDSDAKDAKILVDQICNFYKGRTQEDEEINIVKPENVLVLKYYSFENYFLFPEVMVKIGVVKSTDEFYNILFTKYKDYLYKLQSVKNMKKITGIQIKTKEDLIENMEAIRTYVRGHNLYDIFYSRYKKEKERSILRKYIEVAPKEIFEDIFNKIDSFSYFSNRRIK